MEYRKDLWDLCLPVQGVSVPRKKLNYKRRFVLNYFFNGPLYQTEVQHFCLHGCCADYATTLRRISKHVCWALMPNKPPIFARSRWTKWDLAIDAVLILAGVHGLLKDVFYSYIGEQAHKAVIPPVENILGTSDAISDWDTVFKEEVKAVAIPASDCKRKQNEPASVPTAAPQESDQTGKKDEKQTFAEFNKQQRLLAKDWVNTNPFLRLCIMKEVAAGLMFLMYRFLRFSGVFWEKQQRLRSSRGQRRSYPVLEAAQGEDIETTMEFLFMLLQVRPRCVQAIQFTPLLKALRFRMVSCALCNLHVLLRHPRQGFPFRLFKLLLSDEHAQAILDTPVCFHDALTNAILKKYEPWNLLVPTGCSKCLLNIFHLCTVVLGV